MLKSINSSQRSFLPNFAWQASKIEKQEAGCVTKFTEYTDNTMMSLTELLASDRDAMMLSKLIADFGMRPESLAYSIDIFEYRYVVIQLE